MKKLHNITPLITTEKISWRIAEMAQEIASQMPPDLMIVGLLRGSFVFAADLLRALHAAGAKNNIRPQVDFMTLLSYGKEKTSSGNVTVARDIADPVRDRDVLIIDDILESGRTLTFAQQRMKEGGARSVKIAVLLEKPGKRKVDINADYVGFVIPDKFVVGYGLDYANYYRELPYIGVIEENGPKSIG